MMQGAALEAVAQGQAAFSVRQRRWCLGELTGLMAEYNPLPAPEQADDAVLAACLLRAWIESIRCDCR